MFIHVLDMIGVALYAITGTLAAGRKKMDVFGILVVAIVTAIGGGTARDLILGVRPVFWVADQTYLIVASAAALVTFVYVRYIKAPYRALLVFDAFGLALFTVIGCQKAMAVEAPYVVVVVMGVMTGVAGGVIRDILCNDIPLVFTPIALYATASLLGAVVFVLLSYLNVDSTTSAITASSVIAVLRLFAVYKRVSLPVYKDIDTSPNKEN